MMHDVQLIAHILRKKRNNIIIICGKISILQIGLCHIQPYLYEYLKNENRIYGRINLWFEFYIEVQMTSSTCVCVCV